MDIGVSGSTAGLLLRSVSALCSCTQARKGPLLKDEINPEWVYGSYTIQGFIESGYRAPTFKGHFVLKDWDPPREPCPKGPCTQIIDTLESLYMAN